MPKNSRPDIQVLEARVVRLKTQLLEYKEIRTYDITKRRLAAVGNELEECLAIIDEITQSKSQQSIVRGISPSEVLDDVNEFNDDGDLADLLFEEPTESTKDAHGYAPKTIISNYAMRLKECSETPTGILQVNQICYLLYSWFTARYTPKIKNPNFYYKASRIHEWIDLLLIACGQAIHKGEFPIFIAQVDNWIENLGTSKDEGWMLPLEVRKIGDADDNYTKEAIVAEKIIKDVLYDSDFYGDLKDSVSRIVIQKRNYPENSITIKELLEDCPKLIPTSSFDIKKYQ